jgi:hypothetical protein
LHKEFIFHSVHSFVRNIEHHKDEHTIKIIIKYNKSRYYITMGLEYL